MKNVSAAFLAMVQSNQELVEADLYTITLQSGVTLYYTSAQENIVYNGHTFQAANTLGMGPLLQNPNFQKNTSGTQYFTSLATNATASDGWSVGVLGSGYEAMLEPEDLLIRLQGGTSIPANSTHQGTVQSQMQTVTPSAPFTLAYNCSAANNVALPSGISITLYTIINWYTAAGALITQTIASVAGAAVSENVWPYTVSGSAPSNAYFAQVFAQAACTNANGTATMVGAGGQLPADLRWYNVQLTQYSTPGFHRGSWRCTRGLNTDDLEVDIVFDGNTRILGQGPGAFANSGGFDLATVRLDKALAPNWLNPVVNGVVNVFTGIVGEVQATSSKVTLTVSNNLLFLNQSFPTNYFLPQCGHALYDDGCGLNKALFAVNGTVTSASTSTVLAFSTNMTNPDGWFSLGYLVWTSGANQGIECTIKLYYNANGQVQLIYPLSSAPAPGDTFTAYAGCDKLQITCSTKFNNLPKYRGYPYTPTPETLEVGGTGSQPPASIGGGGGAGLQTIPRGPGGLKGNFTLQ